MSKLDFSSIYQEHKVDYIHSHAKNFHSSIETKGGDFSGVLKDIKNHLVKVLERDIKNFRAIEDLIAEQQIKKFKDNNIPIPPEFNTHDRHGLKNYMSFLTKVLKEQGVTPLTAIVKFKTNMIEIKKQGTSYLDDAKALSQKMFGKEWGTLNKQEQKQIEKELELKRKKLEKNVNNLMEGIAEYLNSLIIFLLTIYDPHQNKSFVNDKTLNTAAKRILEIFESLGIKPSKGKKFIKDIKDAIKNLGPEKFLATFLDDSGTRDFFEGIGKNVQANQFFGVLFEEAFIKAFTGAVVEGIKGDVSIFDRGDIVAMGSDQSTREATTMDVQFIKKDTNLGKIRFGASLKLRGKDKISSSVAESRWQQQFISFLGQENFKTFSYFRKNLIALSSFKIDEETKLKYSLNELIVFEKEILDIIAISRLLIGLYEFVEGQYKTTGMDGESFYYTAYIFGLDSIISSSDALEALLNDALQENKSITMKKESVSKNIKQPLDLKNNQILSKKQLEKFWENKQKAMKKIRKRNRPITYKGIMSDENILQELLNLNEALGDFSYEGTLVMETTANKIKESIAAFNKNKVK